MFSVVRKTLILKSLGFYYLIFFSLDFHGNKGTFPGRVSLPARGEVLLYLRENGALEVLGF